MESVRNFCPFLTKSRIPRWIFIKIPVIQSRCNTFWFESRCYVRTDRQEEMTDRWTDGRTNGSIRRS